MESGKIDIDTEWKGPKEPVATYKSVPEDDSLTAVKESAKEEANMTKQNGDTDIEDPAQELMLKDSTKINSNKDASEVKFISENGDAKIDMEAVKHALTGMTKEELMKFANDPFWIRLRWFMFLAFWLLWAAMLAGAIAIIVMAPKCTAPEPKKSWEESPIVHLRPLKSEGGLKGLIPILKKLKEKHIKVISIGPILKGSPTGHTEDFRDIDTELGNIEDFKELVKAAKDSSQEIILEVDPNHTSEKHYWFTQSVQGIERYKNYYVWKGPKSTSEDRTPNNWLSVYGGSAWEWSAARGEFYLHQFNKTQPDLNYENPAVVEEFSNILEHWMTLGVTGFRIAHSQYLLENLAGGDEASIKAGPGYESLHHIHTFDLTNNSRVLKKWRQKISNHTENKGLFSLQEDIGNDTLTVFNDNSSTLIDLPQKSYFLSHADDNISASAIQKGVQNNVHSAKDWPAWNLNDGKQPLKNRLSQNVAESLTLMTLLLPGTPILSRAQTEYPGKAFAALTKARSEPSFLHGNIKNNITDGTVFIYTRNWLKSGNPGYLVAYQSGANTTVLDLSKFDNVSDDVTITALSSNYNETGIAVGKPIPSNEVPISAKSTLVVQFTPK